jgi:hypothetical protein
VWLRLLKIGGLVRERQDQVRHQAP